MHILGLCGAKGAGKDYVCNIIKGILGPSRVERIAFADPLKDTVAAMLGISRKAMDENKDAKTTWRWKDLSPVILVQLPHIGADRLGEHLTIREVLQVFGTEYARNCWSRNVWIRAWQARAEASQATLVVATDCRFANEIEAIQGMRGQIWRILGGEDCGDAHVSEQEWRQVQSSRTIDNRAKTDHALRKQIAEVLGDFPFGGAAL